VKNCLQPLFHVKHQQARLLGCGVRLLRKITPLIRQTCVQAATETSNKKGEYGKHNVAHRNVLTANLQKHRGVKRCAPFEQCEQAKITKCILQKHKDHSCMWAKNQQNAQFEIKNRRKRAKKQRFWHKNAVKIRNYTFNSEHCLLLANNVRFCFTKN